MGVVGVAVVVAGAVVVVVVIVVVVAARCALRVVRSAWCALRSA